MARDLVPAGPLAHPDVLCALLGAACVPPLTGEAADKLWFFAKGLGVSPEAPGGDLPEPRVLAHAAREVAGYFGKLGERTLAVRMPMILARAAARVAAADAPDPVTTRSATCADRVEVLSRRATHQGYFLTETYELRHPGFEGGMSEALRREVFVATDAAIVLPYDPVRDRVLLVEQFRMRPFGRGDPYPWVLEPVAGRIDAGESAETCARRECVEEAGLDLHALEHVSSHYCSPGCSTERFHCFVGLCDLPEMTRGLGGLETEHEDIRTHVLSFAAGMDLVRSGEANIGPMILLFLWLERERARLRAAA
ncbi:NUDIX domain-containing protein [Roseovarius aestuariivivens]|uniref:NUDIX domain-containing protein n=1 Tax=Roseovarius aestuariivivens TaxID=1888910 RepID=UPI0010814AF9|nr:NUDIX domain-containing protein [Roseovarius aestuariivivens]